MQTDRYSGMKKRKENMRVKRWMWVMVLAFVISHSSSYLAMAQVGTWRNYLAYSDVQQIEAAGSDLFVRASNNLYQYNTKDQSIYTYDKTKGLSDTYINCIRWCQQAHKLVVAYENSNIDLVETNGNVTNISDIYSKSITGGKNIHNILCHGTSAYLSTDFGVVKINVKDAEISESYVLGFIVTAVAIEGNYIYAQSSNNSVWKADMSENLIDPNNWSKTTTYPSFEEDKTDYNTYIETVRTLKPDGPHYNDFYESKFVGGKLYTTGGAFLSGFVGKNNPGIIQIYDGNKWTVYPNNLEEITGISYVDVNCIDVDPTNQNRVMAAGRTGLYEFQNGQFKTLYNKNNSPLRPAIDGASELSDRYTLVHGIKFDNSGNLWVLNSQANGVNLIVLTKDGQWVTYTKSELSSNGISNPGMRRMMFDTRGLLWFVNTHFDHPSIYCYNPSTDQILRYDKFINQDGTSYDNCYPYDVKEDLSGNIWIATTKGPFYIKSEEVGHSNATLNQEKVARNDGTDLADYLLTGIQTTSIAIDGAGRKWFATNGNGVFLVSEDNTQQVQHFTAENSGLLSDNINYLSVNPQSGEVFMLTEKGLCSYMSDAIDASNEMTKDNVWAYPNPVTPEYTGVITIVGLTLNADVKILAANGALVAEGRSNGGMFTWDGCDSKGNKVASGVYMVATATKDGEKGTVCKIAIVR